VEASGYFSEDALDSFFKALLAITNSLVFGDPPAKILPGRIVVES
jgi:hypothetical protein